MSRRTVSALLSLGALAVLGFTATSTYAFLASLHLPEAAQEVSSLPLSGEPRPRSMVSIIVENHQRARPHHKGLEHALFVAEFLVEGGISRFLVFFDRQELPALVGPVRSLRPYFIEAARPWAGSILFAGGSPEAFDQVRGPTGMPFVNGLGFPRDFTRDETIAAPHNLFVGKEAIARLTSELPAALTLWPPYVLSEGTEGEMMARDITLDFFSSTHNVAYAYDPITKTYARMQGGTLSAARPTNVLIVEAPITAVGEAGRLTLDLTGMGKLLLFRSGTMSEGLWYKEDESSPFMFLDAQGFPLPFASGQTWMTVLPSAERVKWTSS